MLPFSLPSPDGSLNSPEWTCAGFRLGDMLVPVLEYNENFAGWSDDLTALHEDAAGESHPIDIASRDDALAQLRFNLKRIAAPAILEIGCSSGFLLKNMVNAFPTATIVGADVVREPLFKLATELPSVPLMRFDLLRCPLPSESFDAVVMLNVLEHIEDDVGALRQVYRLLKPGGVVVIEVPAGPHLYDAYDKTLMHFRRYRISDVANKLQKVGFAVSRSSHLGFLVYPAFAYVKRRNQRVRPSEDLRKLVVSQASETSTNWLLKAAMTLERHLGSLFSFPFGVRCLAVGKKLSN
jgi:SAM-dependent methyltransferase